MSQSTGKATNHFERALVLLMRIDGMVMMSAILPAMIPLAWMKEIHHDLGMGELPGGPIIGYLTRSLSMLYAVHGSVLLFLSCDARRYLPVVKFLAVMTMLFGVGMAALDIVVGMPLFWIICEGPAIFLIYCVMLWLAGRIQD
jgi:hypothetical protein